MRATAAPAPRFGLPGRIQAPNSRRRAIALVGLGAGGTAVAQRIRAEGLDADLDVRIFTSPGTVADDALATIKSNGDNLHRALAEADMVFLVARPGDDVGLAAVVLRLAAGRHVPVSAIYLVPTAARAGEGDDDGTLRRLRDGALMVVVATDETYVAAMIEALGG